jgi:poly(hydroxyalkanoate) granule-associated protein
MSSNPFSEAPSDLSAAAQRIWLAGLGAMAVAQQQGSRLAEGTSKLFAELVEQGRQIERNGKPRVNETKDVPDAAEDSWTRVQQLVDAQVTAALHRLGVPTKDEIAELSRRVEQLTAAIEALKTQA